MLPHARTSELREILGHAINHLDVMLRQRDLAVGLLKALKHRDRLRCPWCFSSPCHHECTLHALLVEADEVRPLEDPYDAAP